MPNKMPVVSIIIPNYNHARFVGDAINSVLYQTYKNYEVIVVDDGSNDNSRQIISNYGNKVKTIYQVNQGLSAARNAGINASKGEYIGVLDADDMYEPEFIQTLVSALESQPEANGIYCGYRFVDEGNHPLPQVEARAVPPAKLFQALVDGNFLVPESMFVHRDCYEKVGLFDTSLRALEDLDMWLRITSKFKIIHTTQVLTRHRILAGSMSTDPSRQFENRMAVLKKHFGAEPRSGEVWPPEQRQAYGRGYLTSAVEYLQAHNEPRAYECFHSMVKAKPGLLAEVETFYELSCGSQPKGFRGEFASIELDPNFRLMIRLLDNLSTSKDLPEFKRFERSAYANLHYAFGLLAYGQGRSQAARKFLLGALRYSPALLLDPIFTGFAMRSLMGAGLVRELKRLAGRAS